jgi:6-phosphofructokinase 2
MSGPVPAPIVTLTPNPAIDESTTLERLVPDRKLRCGIPRYEPGGGGVNVARTLRRLGGRALAIFPAGGPAGTLLRSLLDAEDVPHLAVPISGWTRENVNVREEATAHQYRFVLPGPELTAKEREALFEAVAGLSPFPAYVVASGSLPPGFPPDFLARVARLARSRGARFVLDSAGEAASRALEEGVHLYKPSLGEFRELAQLPGAGDAELTAEATRWIRAGRCEAIVLSLGAAGALCVTPSSAEHVRAPMVPVRSTVGAGDAMLAGVVMRLQEGWPLERAVRFGVAAAAASVMRPGTELCHRTDADRLFEEMGAGFRPPISSNASGVRRDPLVTMGHEQS